MAVGRYWRAKARAAAPRPVHQRLARANAVARLDLVAVVGNGLLAGRRQGDGRGGRGPRADARGAVIQRQVKSESAALAENAVEADFSTEQGGQLTGDRQAQPGAAVFAAGAGIGLLKGLEDELLLFGGDADARVTDGKGNHVEGAAGLLEDRKSVV